MSRTKKIKVTTTHSYKLPERYIKVPVISSKNIVEVAETLSSDKLRVLAKGYALTAVELCNDNKYELAETHAMAALILYDKLDSNRQLYPSEIKYITSADNVINLCKSGENEDKK